MVNQWLARNPSQLGMLLKMICKFNGLPDVETGSIGLTLTPFESSP